MKTARKVLFPNNRPLTKDEYEDFYNHALNSSMWYVTNFMRNSNQVREKLYDKGYPHGEIHIKGIQSPVNIVETVVEKLQDLLLIDDESYAENKAKSLIYSGKWGNVAFYEMLRKGIEKDLAEKTIKKFFTTEEAFSTLDRIGPRIVEISKRKKLDRYKTKTDIVQKLMGKGFPYGIISEWLEDQLSEENEDGWT